MTMTHPGQPEPLAADHDLPGLSHLGHLDQLLGLEGGHLRRVPGPHAQPAEVVLGGQLACHAPPVEGGGLRGGHAQGVVGWGCGGRRGGRQGGQGVAGGEAGLAKAIHPVQGWGGGVRRAGERDEELGSPEDRS